MPKAIDLTAVAPEEVRALPGFKTVSKVEANFVKLAVPAGAFRTAHVDWVKSVAEPKIEQPSPKPIKAVILTASHVDSLRAVHESGAASAEMVAQGLPPDQMLGVLYSSLVTLEYTKMVSERKQRLAGAADKKTVETQWAEVVAGFQSIFAAAGVKVGPAELDKMALELSRKKANLDAVISIANSAKDAGPATAKRPMGNFVTQVGVLKDLSPAALSLPPNICNKPIEGKFTKHFGHAFNLQVTLNIPCGIKWHPFGIKYCPKTFTIAGVSFSLDLEVGYRITCCGASAWGQAAVQACATVIGISVCASCTARITAVAGVSHTSSGSTCSYGLGLNAELKCALAGVTLLQLSAPFGWTITGPCPPPGFKC